MSNSQRSRRLHFDVLDVELAAVGLDLVEMLGQHLEAHVLEQRDHVRQRDVGAETEHLEMQRVGLAARAVEIEADVVGVAQARGHLDIGGGDVRRDFLDVADRQRAAEARRELEAFVLAVLLHERVAQLVVPVAHDLRDLAFELGGVVAGLVAGLRAHDQMQVRQRRFADLDRRIDALAVQRALQRRLDALAHFGAEAVARQIDEARIEAAVLVATHEQARARALLQREDAGRGRVTARPRCTGTARRAAASRGCGAAPCPNANRGGSPRASSPPRPCAAPAARPAAGACTRPR